MSESTQAGTSATRKHKNCGNGSNWGYLLVCKSVSFSLRPGNPHERDARHAAKSAAKSPDPGGQWRTASHRVISEPAKRAGRHRQLVNGRSGSPRYVAVRIKGHRSTARRKPESGDA
jgi:hypothetical protein